MKECSLKTPSSSIPLASMKTRSSVCPSCSLRSLSLTCAQAPPQTSLRRFTKLYSPPVLGLGCVFTDIASSDAQTWPQAAGPPELSHHRPSRAEQYASSVTGLQVLTARLDLNPGRLSHQTTSRQSLTSTEGSQRRIRRPSQSTSAQTCCTTRQMRGTRRSTAPAGLSTTGRRR